MQIFAVNTKTFSPCSTALRFVCDSGLKKLVEKEAVCTDNSESSSLMSCKCVKVILHDQFIPCKSKKVTQISDTGHSSIS